MSNKKIINFQKDSEFYYKLAINSAETGNLCNALEYLRRATKLQPDCIDYRLFMAELYFDMQLFEFSINEYFKILRDGDNLECYFGLGQNYVYLDEYAYAVNYFKKCLEYADLDVDDLEYAEEIVERLSEESSENTRHYEPLINWARGLLKNGDAEYAVQLLKFVPEKSSSYIEASNYLALAYCILEKPEHATTKIAEILQKDPDNIFALCTLISVCNSRGDFAQRDSLVEEVLSIKCSDSSDYFKIATALCEIKDHKNAVKYLEKVLIEKPYDITTLTLLAIGCFNVGREAKAKEYLSRLIKIDSTNSIAKYYNALKGQKSPSVFEYNCQVPYQEAIARIKKIEHILKMPMEEIDELYQKDSEFAELIKWSQSLQDSQLVYRIFGQMSFCPSFYPTTLEMISSVFVNNYLKKLLIRNICYQKKKKFVILIDAELKEIKPVYPRELAQSPAIFTHAYANFLSTLCFMENGFERKASRMTKEVIALLAPCERIKSIEGLSAVFAFEYGIFEGNLENICEVFDAKITTVKGYLRLLDKLRSEEI